MSTIQIHQFPTIPQAPADADVLAIEVNGITYKVSKAVLAAAIANNITPGDIGAYTKNQTDAAIEQSTAKTNVADKFSFASGWGGTINAYRRGDVVQLYVAISTAPTLTANTAYEKVIIRDTSVGAATNVFAHAQRGSSYNKIGTDYLATLPSGSGANDGIGIAVGDTVGSGTIRFSMVYVLA